MKFLFREIRNKSWWDKSHEELPWLNKGELIADVFKSLGTHNGDLSTYVIEADKSNLNQVVAAYACTRESLQRVDYVLIPYEVVDNSFELKDTPGSTADDAVNSWHRDISELTPQKLLDLVYLINSHRDKMTRIPRKTVEKEVCKSRKLKNIDCEKVHPTLKEKICD